MNGNVFVNPNLCLGVESLEQRRMLAADVSIAGATIKINGTTEADFVEVYVNSDEIVVFDGDTDHFTGLNEADRLIINLKDGGDSLFLSNEVSVKKVTTIKLGNGNNEATLGGVHSTIRLLGGRDADYVNVSGVVPLKRAVVNLKSGNDDLNFAVDRYADAVDDGIISEDDALSLLESPPKISFNLGSGDDTLALISDLSPIDEELIEDLLDEFEVESLEELVEMLEDLAADAGLSNILKGLRINGGSGIDISHPGGFMDLLSVFGANIRGFDIDGIVTEA